jgi:sugar transferase EpsL
MIVKRGFDIILAIVLLLILSPVLVVIGIAIHCFMGSPVIFTQIRPGFHEKCFTLFKFRTMKETRDDKGNLLPDEVRTTVIGNFIRKFSMDELPQLINIIRNEMSFTGPRPLLNEYLPLYNTEQRRRLEVKPGITGWAQVNGRNSISWEEKFKLDVWYVDNRSLWLDMKILWLTVIKVLKRDGISQEGSATMEKFRGNNQEVVGE